MNNVKRFERRLLSVEENFVAYSVLLLIILQILQVFFRYILSNPLGWINEFSSLLFVWLIMIGSAVGVQWVEHFSVPFVEEKFSPKLQRFNKIFTNIISIIFMLYLIIFGLNFLLSTTGQVTANLGIPVEIPYMAIPAGGFLMIVHLFLKIMLTYHEVKINKGGEK